MSASDGYTHLRVEIDGGLARVTLARPEARNAVNLALGRDLKAAFERLDAADDVRLVRIEADGPVFSAGADLKERQGRDQAWMRARRLAGFAAYDTIERCSKPVIAVVDGACVGSGCEIALAADFIIASTRGSFRFPEVQWGTVGATQRLQRVVGKRMAKEMLFTGRVMGAEEAVSVGIVNRAVPPEALAAAVEEISALILKAPPLTMALTKQAIDMGGQTDQTNGIRIELAAIERAPAATEWQEGVGRFVAAHGGAAAKPEGR